ncbi:hypothetical protein APHNP_0376 [Anaplasma phagocytophilum str. ApNP]|uniref:Uncharacterized protein n=1 Tax=Anaplasma phagocytophilum str. ApNP TaxID=1359153 RepID=A0A0F3NHN2_ANAPH|nr:hypothetical protein APHNP_0376 [Anaplasma phagocytophilum str. ApNP]
MVGQVVRLEITVTENENRGNATGSKADRGFCDQSTML